VNEVVELRQYTLRPGGRDVLIRLFDREFVESQEAEGMAILGQFRDLDHPDRFVWLRGFADISGRAAALGRFYGGPVWKAHSAEANATMLDIDDVLLLRPASPAHDFPRADRHPKADRRTPPDHAGSLVLGTIHHRDRPFDDEFLDAFERRVRPALVETGATPLACLWTEYAENDFPALPVRTGEHVFVWFARFAGADALADHLRRDGTGPALAELGVTRTHRLRLAPTDRSMLR